MGKLRAAFVLFTFTGVLVVLLVFLIIKDKILCQALLQAQNAFVMTFPYISLSRRHLLGPDKRSISALALTKADQPLLTGDKQLQMEQREPAEFRPVCPG